MLQNLYHLLLTFYSIQKIFLIMKMDIINIIMFHFNKIHLLLLNYCFITIFY